MDRWEEDRIRKLLSTTIEKPTGSSENYSLNNKIDPIWGGLWGDPPPLGFSWNQNTHQTKSNKPSMLSKISVIKHDGIENHDLLEVQPDLINTHAKFYIEWIEALIALQGGQISDEELRKEMKRSNEALFKSIEDEFGGVIHLLVRYPEKFQLSQNYSSKWMILSLDKSSLNRKQTKIKDEAYELQVEPKPSMETHCIDQVIHESAAEILDTKTFTSRYRRTRSSCLTIDEKIVDQVIESSTDILKEASGMSLKAVELANTLRARLGTSVLAEIRDYFGGLLSLLEKYPDTFDVQRIPKSDMVKLKLQDHLHLGHLAWQICGINPAEKCFITPENPETLKGKPSGVLRACAPEFVLSSANNSSTKSPVTHGYRDPQIVSCSSMKSHFNQNFTPQVHTFDIQPPRNMPSSLSCPVLQILTSEKCVPTKAWPVDIRKDLPFLQIIHEQLQQAGGSMTISKLRGLLRMRISSNETVKSVPLKALIRAYSRHFTLRGNQVHLAKKK